MSEQKSFWKRIGLQDWFLKTPGGGRAQDAAATPTPDDVYRYLIDKFQESVKQLSFADRIVFYHEYIICFNEADYRDFMANKSGLFGVIAHEAVKEFGKILEGYRKQGKMVMPSASKWVFRFVSHPDYERGDKGFIGKLLPDATIQKEENLRVTYIPRQTGIAETQDINENLLRGFNYYTEGYYELPYIDPYKQGGAPWSENTQQARARLETVIPDKAYSGKKVEYLITEDDITVSGSDAASGSSTLFRIPSEWVNTPHLRIRFDKKEGKFYLASFGEKTMVNEREIVRSTADNPSWTELPLNSNIVLNGIVGINIFKA